MPNLSRRLTALAVAALFAVGAVGATPGRVAAADLTLVQAEQEMVRLLNAVRAEAGLVPVRVDSRLTALARQRSQDMANRHYFSHTTPEGGSVFDMINASGMKWYGAGEILAWNTWPTLAESAPVARDSWMGSPGHREIAMSTSYNYFGIGLAIDPSDGRKVWTGVYLQGPDRTAAWARFAAQPSITRASTSRYRDRVVRWRGGDVQLVIHTAGLRHYQVQLKTDRGSWRWVSRGTLATSRTVRVWRGHTYRLRVRACDRVGNCGAWQVHTLRG